MRTYSGLKRIKDIQKQIRMIKEDPDRKDIHAAVLAIYEKLGPTAVLVLLHKFKATNEQDIPRKERARFLRMAKDLLEKSES